MDSSNAADGLAYVRGLIGDDRVRFGMTDAVIRASIRFAAWPLTVISLTTWLAANATNSGPASNTGTVIRWAPLGGLVNSACARVSSKAVAMYRTVTPAVTPAASPYCAAQCSRLPTRIPA